MRSARRLKPDVNEASGPQMKRVAALSEIPWRDQFKTGDLEIRQVTSSEAAAIDTYNGGNHAIRRRHANPLPESITHDLAIG